jgi:hypothetical protein
MKNWISQIPEIIINQPLMDETEYLAVIFNQEGKHRDTIDPK